MADSQGFLASAYAAGRQAGLSDPAARVAASQAALESRYGQSAPGNNYYGIKAGKSWKGPTQRLATTEVVNGKRVRVMADFRAYPNPVDSFKDWAKVVAKNWPGVLTAKTFKEAVHALNAGKVGGYATDDKYNSKLASINSNIGPSLPDTPPLPPERYQTIAAKPVAPNVDNMRVASTLASITPDGVPDSVYSAPLGEVTRSPLGPVSAPSVAPSNAYATTNLPSVTRAPSVPTAPSRAVSVAPSVAPSNAYATTNLPSVSKAPSVPSVAPSNAYATTNLPSVAPKAPSVPTSAIAGLMAAVPTAKPQTFTPQPTALVTPQKFTPPPATPVSRVSAPVSRPSVPSAPRATAMDVYNGKATTGVANNGSTVSRDQYGNTHVTNQFGVTTTTSPNGTQMGTFGGLFSPPAPSAPTAPGISGPLGAQSLDQSKGFLGIEPAKTETGNLTRGIAGSVAGSALGSVLGPVGSLVGAALGRSIAQGKNPFDGLMNDTFSVNTTQGAMNFASPQAGLGFPDAPTAPGALGGTQSNRSMDGMRGISPGAAAAIGAGKGGLY